jgi:hypothetical protein
VPAVRAEVAVHAVVFSFAMRARVALRALVFPLPMRAPLASSHRLARARATGARARKSVVASEQRRVSWLFLMRRFVPAQKIERQKRRVLVTLRDTGCPRTTASAPRRPSACRECLPECRRVDRPRDAPRCHARRDVVPADRDVASRVAPSVSSDGDV